MGNCSKEEFLLFQQRFQKNCTADTLKQGLVLERVKKLCFCRRLSKRIVLSSMSLVTLILQLYPTASAFINAFPEFPFIGSQFANYSQEHSLFYSPVVSDRRSWSCSPDLSILIHSLVRHFEPVPNSKKLQSTTEMWLLKDFKVEIAVKTLWEKVKLLFLSNFTFFHNIFLKFFFLHCVKTSIYGGKC